jgi:hypothetical protein
MRGRNALHPEPLDHHAEGQRQRCIAERRMQRRRALAAAPVG